MQDIRALGLCYNCDEKFIPGHKCTSNRFLLLLIEDEPTQLDTDQPPPEEEDSIDIENPKTYF